MPQSEIERLLAQRTWLRGLCRGLVGGADAEALAEDTLVAAWERSPATGSSLKPWLAAVARRLAATRRRSEGRRARREQAAARPERTADLTSEAAERAELAERAAGEVRGLPEPYRSVVLLRFFEDLAPREIARQLDRPAATVRSQLTRGLDLLRERLDAADPRGRAGWWPVAVGVAEGPSSVPFEPTTTAALGGLAAVKTTAAVIAVASLAALALLRSKSAPADVGQAAAASAAPTPAIDTDGPVAAVANNGRAPVAATAAPDEVRARGSAPVDGVGEELAEPTGTILFRAVDPSGVALPGATAELFDADRAPLDRRSAADASGSIAIEVPIPADQRVVWLRVTAPNREQRLIETLARVDGEHRLGEVTLAFAGEIIGTVRFSDGRRPSSGQVTLTQAADEPGLSAGIGPLTGARLLEVDLADDGSFRLTGAGPGWWRVWAKADGSVWTASEPFELSQGERREGLEVVLDRIDAADRIAGQVVNVDGDPVPGARLAIQFSTSTYSTARTDIADDEGRFDFVVAASVPHDFIFTDPELVLGSAVLDGVRPGAVDLIVTLPDSAPVELAVFGRGGEVQRFTWTLTDWSSYEQLGTGEHDVALDGRAALPAQARAFRLEIEAAGHVSEAHGPFEPNELDGRIEIELTPAARIAGRVEGDGRALAGAVVRLCRALPADELHFDNGFRSRYRTWSSSEVITDQDGAFELRLQREGEHYFIVDAEGFAPTEIGPFDFDQGADESDLLLVALRHGRLVGRVIMPAGADGEGTILGLNRGDGRAFTFRAGPGGSFELDDLAPGPWQLRAREDEILPTRNASAVAMRSEVIPFSFELEIEPGQTTHFDLDLSHRGPCVVRGVLSGESFEGWSATMSPATTWFGAIGEVVDARVDADGAFELTVPFDGTYNLTLLAPGAQGALDIKERIDVEAGANDWELSLTLGSIEGRAPVDAPPLRARWVAPREGVVSALAIEPDPSGGFVLDAVPAGEVVFEALEELDGNVRWRQFGPAGAVEVPAGGLAAVDLH